MTTVLYNNWYDFYSYLFTTYTSESITKTLIEDFIKKHNIQDGLNVLVDFLETNEGLSHDLIIKIITILRKSSIKFNNICISNCSSLEECKFHKMLYDTRLGKLIQSL
jgi:hypothetical protein